MTQALVPHFSYEKVATEAMPELEGHFCWPVDWVSEDLPNETRDGTSLEMVVEAMVNQMKVVPKVLENYVKIGAEEQMSLPGPTAPKKEGFLIFADSMGYTKGIFENAPDGRISSKKIVDNYARLTQDDVSKYVSGKGVDVIVFAPGIDPPMSNSVPDVLEQDAIVSRLYFWVLQEVQRQETPKKIVCLTRGIFTEDKKVHRKAGLGICSAACLFGMGNSARLELEGVLIQYIDTEYYLREDSKPLFQKLAAEIFRETTFGQNNVRILYSGRYVMRQVSSTAYEAANKAFPIPDHGVIAISGGNGALGLVMGNWLLDKAAEQEVKGFAIQFLSRSMKITDLNMPLWKAIQAKAERLGVKVEQARMDMSTQENVDSWVASATPNLQGFIHSAGVLQDSMLMNLTWEKFETVFDSKHRAALYLHSALERYVNPELSFLWMFSSTSVFGNMGQINYSGSNHFQNILSAHRIAKGKPSLAIQWGAWGDVGMAATMTDAMRQRMMSSPMPYFSNKEGLAGLECGLLTGLPYFSVFKFNPPVMFGMIQAQEHPNMNYGRNFTCEVVPTPLAPSLDRKYLYNAFRTYQGSYIKNPLVTKLVFDAYTKPAIAANEKEFGDDFRQWS